MRVIILLILLSLVGCRTYIPVETIRYEKETINTSDTIVMSDSVIIRERGDTITIERISFRDRIIREKEYVYKVDSIPYIKEVEKIVTEYKTRWYDKAARWIALIVVIAFIIYIGRSFR
ncbi:MAG: hypothetical protein RR382_01870 [Tannerellaceae bacterium]